MKFYRSNQHGLSLVELLIAMALGLMLTLGALQMMLSSQTMYSTTDTLSRIQESGRFALNFIAKDVRMAGYFSDSLSNIILHEDDCDGNPCTFNGGGTNSDQFAVLLDPESDLDCLGNIVGDDDVIANVYFIDTQNQVSSLYCRSLNTTTNNWYSAAQPLVDGIENMQVLYGVADPSDDYRVSQYVPEGDAEITNWAEIGALKISLLVNNGQTTGNGDNLTRQFVLLDEALSFTDRHNRQVFTTTVTVNNIYYRDDALNL